MDPSLRIFASKPGITFNLLLLATVVSALNSSKYLGTQSDVLLTCSVMAITFSPIFSARAMTFLIVRFEQNDRYSYSEHGSRSLSNYVFVIMIPAFFTHSVHNAYNKLLVKSTRYLLIAMNVRIAPFL